jgi:hypothetical protein
MVSGRRRVRCSGAELSAELVDATTVWVRLCASIPSTPVHVVLLAAKREWG